MESSKFNCHSQRLAGYLMLRGAVLWKIEECKKSRRNIFLFKNSEYIQKLVLEYKDEKHKFIN